MLRRSFAVLQECRAAVKGRQAFGTHMVHRETFLADPHATSSTPFPQELNQWVTTIEEPLHSSTAENSEMQEQNRYLRCQSPDNMNSQEVARRENSVMWNRKTELELSVESRSFVNRVNDQVRNRQQRISNVAEDEEEHSLIWWMFVSVTMESAVFMGKNYLDTCHSITKTKHTSHWNKCSTSAKLSLNKMRSQVWKRLFGKNIHGIICLSLVMKESSIFNARKSTSFRILWCLGKILQNLESNEPLEPWHRAIRFAPLRQGE